MFLKDAGPRLRHAFISRYGPDVGAEALSDAVAAAWERWGKVSQMVNPAGWVYRVGQSRSRRYIRKPKELPFPPVKHNPEVEPGLPLHLSRLSQAQRVSVMMVHAYGYTVRETADLLGVSPSTVQRNSMRGLAHLRRGLGVSENV